MAGLLDFLFANQNGGGLLGLGQNQPMNIQSPVQQQGVMSMQQPMQQPQGIDPQMFARMMQPQQPSMFDNPLVHLGLGLAGGNTAGEGIANGLKGLQGYQAQQGQQQQQALANYVGLSRLQLEQKAAEEKPQYQKIKGPDGAEHIVLLQPYGRGAQAVIPSGMPSQNTGDIPPGLNAQKVIDQRSSDYVANEQDAVKNAKAAADFQPIVDQAVSAYEKAIQHGAIGPIVGNSVSRAVNQYTLGTEGEKARQDYDKAKAALQARITAAQNKGEGAVSNFERQMYAAQFPDLTALDPSSQLQYLKQIQAQTKQTVAAGKVPSLGQAPAVAPTLERPSIPGAQTPQAPPVAAVAAPTQASPAPPSAPASPAGPAIAPPSAPIKIATKAQYDLLPKGAPYLDPTGTPRTKQ